MLSSTRYDVAVVGGGLAGLTAAALLGKAGVRTVLLERSHAVGGRAMTSNKAGFHLNLGPHAWYMGGPGTAILNDLGIALPGLAPRSAGLFALRDHRLYTLPVGFVSLLTTDLLGAQGKLEMARMMVSIPRMETSAFDDIPISAWLAEHMHDDRARGFLEALIRLTSYVNAPDLLSAGAALAALQSVLRSNVRYLDGGWQTIVSALETRTCSFGVEVRCSSSVESVVMDDRVYGVRLAGGDGIAASAVILAVEPAMVQRLAPDVAHQLSEPWPAEAAKAACLDLALRRLPRRGAVAAFGVDRPLYCSVHSASAVLAPPGGAVIHAAKYLAPSGDDAHGSEQELEAIVDLLQPGWRREIVARRFLPELTVTHTIPSAARRGLRGRVPVQVPGINGVFLAGDWVGERGTLANASVTSAARAASLALRQCHARSAVA